MTTQPHAEIDPVLRIPDVSIARDVLESALGLALSRFEQARRTAGNYAQINMPEKEGWEAVVALLNKVGPALQDCAARGEIGTPELDVGFHVPEACAHKSLQIPARAGLAIFRYGIDVRISVYRVTPEEAKEELTS